MRVHQDHRRKMTAGIFGDATPGDVNLTELAPGVVIAWHRHQLQTDYVHCLAGSVKVGIIRGRRKHPEWHILHGGTETVVEIPPNSWHGYRNLSDATSTLLGYISRHYDAFDEERRSIEEVGVQW